MSVRIKRVVIVGMLSLVTIPFIMLADLFPFMRFGMFAEPIRHEVQKEYFQVFIYKGSGKEQVLSPADIGMDDHFYEYMIRNYFYRGEGELLLNKIESMVPGSYPDLKRYPGPNQPADTTINYPLQ